LHYKLVITRPFADPEAAARKLMEIANSIEPVQDGRIYIELINWPFLHEVRGNEYTRPVSTSRSNVAGCGSTRAAPM
jgi:hypothetical protein